MHSATFKVFGRLFDATLLSRSFNQKLQGSVLRAVTDRSGGGHTSHFSLRSFFFSPSNHAEELELALSDAPVIMQIRKPDVGDCGSFSHFCYIHDNPRLVLPHSPGLRNETSS